jgi:hypothetical protein
LRLDVDVIGLLDEFHAHGDVRFRLDELGDPETRAALDERLGRAIGELEFLHDLRDRADLVEVFRSRVLRLRLALRDQGDQMVLTHRLLEREDGLLATHEKGDHEVREEREVPQGDEREYLGNGDGGLVGHAGRASFHVGVC